MTRNAANRRIQQSATDALSLLAEHEQLCAAQIADAFAGPPTVPRRPVRSLQLDHGLRESWVEAFTDALDASAAHAVELAGSAADLGLRTIRAELDLVELALPVKDRGVAGKACRFSTTEIETSAVEHWLGSVNVQRVEFRSGVTAALNRAPDRDHLIAALFGERGIWWDGRAAALRWSAWLSVYVINRVRMAAMRRFT